MMLIKKLKFKNRYDDPIAKGASVIGHCNISCEDCLTREKGVFCGLNQGELSKLSTNKVNNRYLKGQTIFFQGSPPFGVYCIHDGKVKITKTGPDGKESIVRIAGPGDILGYRSLLSNQNYTASAQAMEEVNVCFFDKKLFREILHDHSSVSLSVIERLSREMGVAQNMGVSLIQKSVRERLAELLLSLKNDHGIPDKDRIRLDIRISRIEIASMIGTASETAIRTISEFKHEGLIAQEGKTIFLLNEEKLREVMGVA